MNQNCKVSLYNTNPHASQEKRNGLLSRTHLLFKKKSTKTLTVHMELVIPIWEYFYLKHLDTQSCIFLWINRSLTVFLIPAEGIISLKQTWLIIF